VGLVDVLKYADRNLREDPENFDFDGYRKNLEIMSEFYIANALDFKEQSEDANRSLVGELQEIVEAS